MGLISPVIVQMKILLQEFGVLWLVQFCTTCLRNGDDWDEEDEDDNQSPPPNHVAAGVGTVHSDWLIVQTRSMRHLAFPIGVRLFTSEYRRTGEALHVTTEERLHSKNKRFCPAAQAKVFIFTWKAHVLRSENQEEAKQTAVASLKDDSIMIVMDWAMKFVQMRHREKQSEWFAKRGKSDDPFSPDFVPSVNLGYFTVKTPSASSIDRFDRFSRRNYEKTLREMDPIPTAKRQLDFGTYKDTDLINVISMTYV
ncbi:hypothetical protein QZH41_007146 [Actinostola sp. cb2023]|nr:hypothetical protein QZH41_007146 [Actinostola sp. cb2023]